MTVAPTSASARTKWRWVGGKAGSTKTTFTASRRVASARMVVAAFVAPFLLPATARFVATAAQLPGVRLGRHHHRAGRPAAAGAGASTWPGTGGWTTRSTRARSPRRWPACPASSAGCERLVGALEQLQVPLAQVREALGIPGMDVETARNVRDKARMKTVLRAAGVPCARHQLVTDAGRGARVRRRGRVPAGRQAAGRRRGAGHLPARRRRRAAQLARRDPAAGRTRPGCSRSSSSARSTRSTASRIGGQTVWASIVGLPAAAAGGAAQPVDPVDGAAAARAGRPALRRHRRDRAGRAARARRARRADATWSGSAARTARSRSPRSAPARRARRSRSMLGYAHDVDFYRAWAELVVLDRFDPPERKYAAGTAYLRGQGRGRVRAVHGVEELQRRIGHLVVEAQAAGAGPARVVELRGRGLRDRPPPGHRGGAGRAAADRRAASGSSWWRSQ